MPPLLHSLNDEEILLQHASPLLCIPVDEGLEVRSLIGVEAVVDFISFNRAAGPLRKKYHREAVVPLRRQQHVREKGDVLCSLVPEPGQSGKVGKVFASVPFNLPVDRCSLSGEMPGFLDVVVVLQARIAVEAGMNPRKVVAFAEILNRQLPVAGDIERKPRGRAAMMERLVVFAPTMNQFCRVVAEFRRIAGDIDENHVAPDR